jgi:hypothetical protein
MRSPTSLQPHSWSPPVWLPSARHTPFDHFRKLPRVLAVRIDTRIGSENHLDARGVGRAKSLPLLKPDHFFLCQAFRKDTVLLTLGENVVIVIDVHVKPRPAPPWQA